ncbi:unnamed protein product [Lactuca saligna]|uniref:Uncharacterized protein n=1 Tax=Lactuca saligna TaxID=75948 RepID=A0AA36EMW5_LACSI|nr:unnamed protein product [Lactuca saligna]
MISDDEKEARRRMAATSDVQADHEEGGGSRAWPNRRRRRDESSEALSFSFGDCRLIAPEWHAPRRSRWCLLDNRDVPPLVLTVPINNRKSIGLNGSLVLVLDRKEGRTEEESKDDSNSDCFYVFTMDKSTGKENESRKRCCSSSGLLTNRRR